MFFSVLNLLYHSTLVTLPFPKVSLSLEPSCFLSAMILLCFCSSFSVFVAGFLSVYLLVFTKSWSLVILFYTFSVFSGFLNLYSQDSEIAISKIFQSFDSHIYLLVSLSGFSWEILKLNIYKNIYFFSPVSEHMASPSVHSSMSETWKFFLR